jgi:hypothetical protein
MRLPSLALLLVAAALPGCAGPTSYRSAFAFRCGSVGHYGLGTLMVARWIRHDRTLAATVLRWLPRMPEDSLIHMEVQWAARPPKDIDLDRGILTITQRVTGGDFVLGSSRSYIELSKTPAGDGSKAAFKGWIEPRKSMDAIHLTADWSGVRQFAGRNDLYLVVHDFLTCCSGKRRLAGRRCVRRSLARVLTSCSTTVARRIAARRSGNSESNRNQLRGSR